MINSFKPLSAEELCESIAIKKKTLILFHINPDADAVGSAFALRELLKTMDIPAYCACSEEIPEKLAFITDGTQGSVLLDGSITVDYERIITVDSASPSQLGELFSRLHKNVDIMIDHHSKGTVYADNYIDSEASATGEIIYSLAKLLLKKGCIDEIPQRALNCIYTAISSDTGSFRFPNTTPKTMRIAAELMETGVDFGKISSLIYDEKPLLQLKAEGEGIKELRLYDEGRIAAIVFPYEVIRELGVSNEHLGTLIDIARSVEGAEVAFVIKQLEFGGAFRVSMRSKGDTDVSQVCSSFGGGGHKNAAGCSIRAQNASEATEELLRRIRRILKNSD